MFGVFSSRCMKWVLTAAGAASIAMAQISRKVAVQEVVLDSAVQDLHWVSENNKIVLVQTIKGRLYRSIDGGQSYLDMTDQLRAPGKSGQPDQAILVDRIIVSPAKVSTVLVVGTKKHHFVTTDSGASWTRLRSKQTIHTFLFHPTRPTWGLLSTWTDACNHHYSADEAADEGDCVHLLYITRDLGATFEPVTSYVVQFSWGVEHLNQQDRVYFSHFRQRKGPQQRLTLWNENVDFSYTDVYPTGVVGKRIYRLLKGGNKFLITNGYIFVAKVKNAVDQTVTLLVSTDGGVNFASVELPRPLEERSYTVLDTSEGAVMLHVYHGHTDHIPTGHVYISDEQGIHFTLSLPMNVRNANGDCEFDKIMSLEGIYMANFLDKDESDTAAASIEAEDISDEEDEDGAFHETKRHGSKNEAQVRTLITWNKGASWRYLKPPQTDSMGKNYDCETGKCWLHLHGVSEYQSYSPFYSLESATGLIMGTGNVGPHMRYELDEINTYISREGGAKWSEAHKGAYIYEFGDHGGLVVMADDVRKTKQVIFSWNEGMSWYDFDISSEPIEVDNIVTEPNATSTNFILHGTRGNAGVIYHLDFATLDHSNCRGHYAPDSVSSDYETWSPTDGVSKCLLGKQLVYTRRKPHAECFNGEDFKRPVERTICQCTPEDYECEVGFVRDIESADFSIGDTGKACHPAAEGGIRFPPCTPGEILQLDGYRRIPGNACQGGWVPQKVSVVCPHDGGMSHGAWSVLFVLGLVGLVLVVITMMSKSDRFKGWFAQRGFDSFASTIYTRIGDAAQGMPGAAAGSGGIAMGPASAMDDMGMQMASVDDFMDDGDDAPRLLNYTEEVEPAAPAIVSEPTPLTEMRAADHVPRLAGPSGQTKLDDDMDLL